MRRIATWLAMMALGVPCAVHAQGEAPQQAETEDDASPSAEEQCAKGLALQCIWLGDWYRDGDAGLPQDTARAIEFYRRACDLSNGYTLESRGCHSLASYYESGNGVPRDLDRALQLYIKSCEADNDDSCSQANVLAAAMSSGGANASASDRGDDDTDSGAADRQCAQLAGIVDSPAPTMGALASLTHTVAVLKASIAMIDRQCGKPWIVSTDRAAIARQRAQLYDAWKKARTGCLQLTSGVSSEESVASLDDSNPCKEVVHSN